MKHRYSLVLSAATVAFALSTSALHCQNAKPTNSWSQEDTGRIVSEVQKRISGLTDYAVFDWITFGIQGKTLILRGFASRPILKDEAGRVVKGIPGIESVDNQIKVLPLSSFDDQIRASVYNRIYTSPSLGMYNAQQGGLRGDFGMRGMAGGLTNDPPLGYHGIHIIVDNGHVTLYGVVVNSGDATVATMQANTAPNVFSVDNDLMVEGSKSAKQD